MKSPFSIEFSEKDKTISHIYDNRYTSKTDITNGMGDFGKFNFTLRSEDVSKLKRPLFYPHFQYDGVWDTSNYNDNKVIFKNNKYNVTEVIESVEYGISVKLNYTNSEFSKFSVSLPLNFMSHKNGYWENQLLVSSPYYNRDTKRLACLFTRPDGNHLMLIAKTLTYGFQLKYSEDGHFFVDFEIVGNADKIYGTYPKNANEIEFLIIPVTSYFEGLKFAAKIWNCPLAYYDISDCFVNEKKKIKIYGECNEVKVTDPQGNIQTYTFSGSSNDFEFVCNQYGFYEVTPYRDGIRGLECICFSHCDWEKMHELSIKSIPIENQKVYGHTSFGKSVWMPPAAEYRGYIDTNLCEHTMWAWSQLKYMLHNKLENSYESALHNVMYIVMAEDESIYRPRQSMIPFPQKQYKLSAFNTYQSDRIQESFNGINILLDYWRVFKDKSILKFAINAMYELLSKYCKGGCILRPGGEDYTTVTAMIIPVVDIAVLLESIGDSRSEFFKKKAIEIADYTLERYLDFPTEGAHLKDYNNEFEEGSMACSALTVLYVARNIIYKPEYIKYASRVMELHKAWTIYTFNAPMYYSSLRWWENLWEGDADGPAICCGHAWTVWQAEADFWLGLLSKNSDNILSSYNAYISNFSKEDKDGNMYSIYQCEPYISGAWHDSSNISRRYAVGFPQKKDFTLSRYVFARAADTWFRFSAIIDKCSDRNTVNCYIRDNVLYSHAPYFDMLFIDSANLNLKLFTTKNIEIFSVNPFKCISGSVKKENTYSSVVQPNTNNIIEIEI